MKWDTGTIISGAGHAALILWVVLGDFLFARKDAPAVQVAEVSLMTSAEFDAMAAAVPATPDPGPPDPAPPDPAPPEPATEVVPPEPVQPQVAAPTEPLPAPEPVPEPLPENNGVADAELLPVVPDAPPPVDLAPASSPRPKPAPRVAPVPVDAPDPLIETAEAPQEAVTPDPAAEPEVVEPETAPTAPQEAGTVLETEANLDEVVTASGAPRTSPRPKGRPARPAPVEAAVDDIADAIAGAVAAAVTDPAPAETPRPTGGATSAPQGPPMTSGEKDSMRVAVQQCWNVGSLSTDALQTTVVVGVSVAENGVPDAGSIRLVSSSGGTEAGARGAFEAARRAIIRCGARGFPLPPEKYEQWREMELVFNPEGMRMR